MSPAEQHARDLRIKAEAVILFSREVGSPWTADGRWIRKQADIWAGKMRDKANEIERGESE